MAEDWTNTTTRADGAAAPEKNRILPTSASGLPGGLLCHTFLPRRSLTATLPGPVWIRDW